MTVLASVEDGVMALDDHPQDYLSWWTSDPADPRSEVTLEQLLSFTSGLGGGIGEVPCVEDGESTIEACAQVLYEDFFQYEPGGTFVYGPSHLQVAGAMLSVATGDSFHRVFRDQIGTPLGLDAYTGFGLPSLNNPRVAGGGTASAADYATILTALSAGELLSPESIERLGQDHTGNGVTMALVPDEVSAGDRDWHYALGCWRECGQDPYPSSCDEPGVLSSPGAFGFYPFWDTKNRIWGVLAAQIIVEGGGASITIPLGQEWSSLAKQAMGLE
jgi:CubicO group peptidase (beta-lactamase class C family)